MSAKSYVYGRHPVAELLRGRPREVQKLYLATAGHATDLADLSRLAQRHRIPVVVVPKHALDDLVGQVPHQGAAALVQAFAYAEIEDLLAAASARGEAPLLVALDQIQDPQNLGSLVRSTLALGGHGVFFPKDRSAEVTPAVVKASAGATSHLPIARVTNLRRALEELKQAGVWVMGAVADGGELLAHVDLKEPCAIVIGSEGQGLRRLTAETCDVLVRIPMSGKLGSL
ncbi:MAG: 23S rRNA (guanosine(2251)-2'-O)-methyltransferase RlmB, partial [Deltaproteobacteria bacterium]|nr:23S rRNA (guanosine(2251)-2'-O)-methyltransferase RlmB [Deltaproteobacteria bacterium]